MSSFSVPFIRIGKIGKHPNADSLSITTVDGCPCIFRTGDFEPGQAAIYVPVDAVIPETVPGTEFLGKKRRIKAMRLRGIFSMGLLLDPEKVLPPMSGSIEPEGRDLSARLGITKYEEPEPLWMQTEQASAPKLPCQPPVYDVESYRKHKSILIPGELVSVTEKLHGTNSRFVSYENQLHVGSHRTWKKYNEGNIWWRMAKKYDLEAKLEELPGVVLYGETFGANVQDFSYDLKEPEVRFFDAFDAINGRWLDNDEFICLMSNLELPMVPVVCEGPYDPAIENNADGKSTLTEKQIREGIVIKPVKNRWDPTIGRVILKLVSENYLTRKGGTENH
jgi:RNA ligase (TIGR02306 family)